MTDRDFGTSTTIAPIGALAELRALVLARSKKRVTLPTVTLGSLRATTASACRARLRRAASPSKNFRFSVSYYEEQGIFIAASSELADLKQWASPQAN